MKAPEMPGRIMAQMGTARQHHEPPAVKRFGGRKVTVIHHAATAPRQSARTVHTVSDLLATSTDEAMIRPGKTTRWQ